MSKDSCLPGFHNVMARLRNDPSSLTQVLIASSKNSSRIRELEAMLDSHGVPHQKVGSRELDDLSLGVNHQGVVGIVKVIEKASPNTLESILENAGEKSTILVLDQVQDPHNLGACIRSAEGAGVDAVVLPKDNSCPLTAVVRKVASGAAELLPVIYVSNLGNTFSKLKDNHYWIYGAERHGTVSLHECEFSARSVIVMGGEGKGMRKLTKQTCDFLVHIPMRGDVESLNVSVATGLMLYEVMRSH